MRTTNGGAAVGASTLSPLQQLQKGAAQDWLLIDSLGMATTVAGPARHKFTHRLGLHARDLRFLDPHLSSSYPAAILDRPNAILVTLEFVKVIITVDSVAVLNPGDPLVATLINALTTKLAGHLNEGEGGRARGVAKAKSYTGLSDVVPKLQAGGAGAIEFPFELKVLEVCLETISSHLEGLALELEAGAYEAVDRLTHQVTKGRLQRVRGIKDKLVHLLPRLNMIRKLIMHFLDDDGDMHGLNLTAQQQALLAHQDSLERGAYEYRGTYDQHPDYYDDSSSDSSSDSDNPEVEAVEMLLDAYFMHVDNTYNRLVTLDLYIEDAEDLVNTKLDFHRNKLYTVNVVISAITTAMTAIVGVTALLSMNLDNTTAYFPEALSSKYGVFNIVVGCSVAFAALIGAVPLIYCYYTRIFI